MNEYPEKVNSIILSGTPYEIPKSIITIQNIIYKFMPKKFLNKLVVVKRFDNFNGFDEKLDYTSKNS